jgi:hypothetical protein
MRKGRDADCDVVVPPVPEAPGDGPLPKYARGGRKHVDGDGKKSRRRLDRGGRKEGGRTTPSGGVKASYRHKAEEKGHTMKGGCLSGDTLVETLNGSVPIADLIGGDCVLLTDHGWVRATIQCFGYQLLSEVAITHDLEQQILLATPQHRWYTPRGIISTAHLRAGDVFPRISANRFQPHSFEPAEAGVAGITEQSTDAARSMVMVDLEGRPFSSRENTVSFDDWDSSAYCAAPPLGSQHRQKLVMADAILAAQRALSTLKPVLVSELNGSRSFGDLGAPADLAFEAIPPAARIEFRRGLGFLAGSANDSFGATCQWGNRATSHVSHSATGWCVEQVRETDLLEPVFCATVPGLHRFVLAGGVLTGNSFPIEDAEDLGKAKHDVGRAHNPAAARRWINKRAGELGEPKLGES